jgi:SWI/SNF-related matrix-associated actin-dependent regulator 1 of chromatin subfamily A
MSEKQKSQEVIPKEITELLEHRATLGKWLAKLEELSGTVRPEVYDRVRGDYEARLRSQETELTAHRSEMETALEERKTRVTVLESDRDERAAELEEAQLRFAVGEFKEAEFQKHKSAHEDRLTTLDDELKSDQDALAKLEEVVGVLGSLRAGASGSAAGSGAAIPEPSGSAEKGETSWGTAHGRAEEGVEGAVEKTKSAAAAAAVAVADARAAEAAEGAILESEEAVPEPQEAEGPEPKGAEARWREAVREGKPEEAEAEGAEETAEPATEEAPAEAEAAEAAADSSAESIVESPADAAAKAESAEGGDYLDDLEFLESLSMDEIDRLDAVSAMLEDEPAAEGDEKGSEESR